LILYQCQIQYQVNEVDCDTFIVSFEAVVNRFHAAATDLGVIKDWTLYSTPSVHIGGSGRLQHATAFETVLQCHARPISARLMLFFLLWRMTFSVIINWKCAVTRGCLCS